MGNGDPRLINLRLSRVDENQRLAVTTLSQETQAKVHSALASALKEELTREGATLGLQDGDLVAISSSVGQMIGFVPADPQ